MEPSQTTSTTPSTTSPAADPAPSDPPSTILGEKKPDATPAPDTYATFAAPEGYTLDPKAIESAVPIFKDLGLSQDQAQRLVDFHTQAMLSAAKAPQETHDAMRNDWRNKVQTDPEMGHRLDTVKTDIGRALSHLDPALAKDFKSAMDLTGAGDHPAFVKAMWKLSQFITEGKHVAGSGPSPLGQKPPGDRGRPSAAHSLYPNLT